MEVIGIRTVVFQRALAARTDAAPVSRKMIADAEWELRAI